MAEETLLPAAKTEDSTTANAKMARWELRRGDRDSARYLPVHAVCCTVPNEARRTTVGDTEAATTNLLLWRPRVQNTGKTGGYLHKYVYDSMHQNQIQYHRYGTEVLYCCDEKMTTTTNGEEVSGMGRLSTCGSTVRYWPMIPSTSPATSFDRNRE